MIALFYGYPRSAKFVIPVLYLGVGLIVWLFGRESYHIGASGLTFGLMFYIFVIGLLRWEKQAMVLSMIVFFLYGGMLGSLLGSDPAISFESHMAGAILGVLCAFGFKGIDPPAVRKQYSWENETEEILEEGIQEDDDKS